VSDPHLSSAPGEEFAERQLAEILAEEPDTPVLLTGDLAGFGERSAYEAIARLLKDREYVCCPGNHDNAEELFDVLGDRRVLRVAGGQIIALNSARTGAVSGRLSENEFRILETNLRTGTEAGVVSIVALHHPPAIFQTHTVPGVLLEEESSRLLEETLLRWRGGVAGLLCGHLHQSMAAPYGGAVAFVSPSSAYALRLVGAELFKAHHVGAWAVHHLSGGRLVSASMEKRTWVPTEETLRRRKEGNH